MFSTYLQKEIEVPAQTVLSAGEVVQIIPHDFLENFLNNDEVAREFNITCHYTHIPVMEPRHYVFLCAISDKHGRRVECIGESLDETLTTEIARNYPALMAYKRAFDAAAIKYLGLEGKVYSDQQCAETSNTPTKAQTDNYSAPPIDDEPPYGTEVDSEPEITPEPEVAPEPEAKPTAPAPAATAEKKSAKATKTQTRSSAKASTKAPASYIAPPLEEEETEATVQDAGSMNFGAPPLDDDDEPDMPDEKSAAAGFSAPPLDDEEENAPAPAGKPDRFDTIVQYGRLKNKNPPLTIRQAYEEHPDIIHWIAETMNAYTNENKTIKALCIEYIKIKEGA